MYQNLLNGAKRRIIQEVENAFLDHPQFADKVVVTNRFPTAKERVQYGVVLRNTYASQIRMSPDNYLADLTSHVQLARMKASSDASSTNYPGLGIEWARENSKVITEYATEDLTAQINPTQTLYYSGYKIMSGPGNTNYADDPGLVDVKVNGVSVPVYSVDGENKKFILCSPPTTVGTIQYVNDNGDGYARIYSSSHGLHTDSTVIISNNVTYAGTHVVSAVTDIDHFDIPVLYDSTGNNETGNWQANASSFTISYWKRILASPGIFRIEFTEDNVFVVRPVYTVDKRIMVERTTGLETTVQLVMDPFVTEVDPQIYPTTDRMWLYHVNALKSDFPKQLVRDVDYSINNVTGLVTFIRPVEAGFVLKADYRYYHPGVAIGPFPFKEYSENHTAIPGVVLCIGRRAKKGDWQVVRVTEHREPQARIFGGHWDLFMTLAVISKDNRQVEEMVDQIVNWLWAIKKNQLEFEGITLTRVEPTGESEENFNDTVTEFYYESTIDISVQTEWQRFIPYPFSIENFSINEQVYVADTRPVHKVPTVGYERES